MFLTLLVVTFLIAFAVSFIVTVIFKKPFNAILHRIVDEEIGQAWSRYLTFAIYVVGISTGVRVWDLEKYITRSRRIRLSSSLTWTAGSWKSTGPSSEPCRG